MDSRADLARQWAFERKRYRELAQLAGVEYDWLCKFAYGHITDPGSSKIEKLLRVRDNEITHAEDAAA